MSSGGCFDKLSGSHHQSQVKSLLPVKRTEYSSCNNRFSGCLGLSGDERQYQLLLLLLVFFFSYNVNACVQLVKLHTLKKFG